MLNYVDKVLVCRDCSRDFVFSAGEQEFYSRGGCSTCRAAASTAATLGGSKMARVARAASCTTWSAATAGS